MSSLSRAVRSDNSCNELPLASPSDSRSRVMETRCLLDFNYEKEATTGGEPHLPRLNFEIIGKY